MEEKTTKDVIKLSLSSAIMWGLFILFVFVAFIYYVVHNENIVEYRNKVTNIINYEQKA